MEQQVLSAVAKSRKAYDKARSAGVERTLSDKGKIVFKEIADYYQRDEECPFVDLGIVTSRLKRKHEKHAELFDSIIGGLDPDVSVDNIVQEILELKKRDVKDRLSSAFTVDGNEEKIAALLDEYSEYVVGGDGQDSLKVFKNPLAAAITSEHQSENLIKLSPPALNQAAGGGLKRGHHMLIFARPDTGKSMSAIELCRGFLQQGLTVVYIGNEDPPADLIMRMMVSLTGMRKDAIMADPNEADRRLALRNWDKFIFVEMTPGTPEEIREVCAEYSPDVLIVDQVRNLYMRESNKVLALESAEKFLRNLGKKQDMATISYTQAGDSGHNKLFLEMNDVDWSNTGMQACADIMVGIGINDEYESMGRRMLSFPKNKLGLKEPKQVDFNWQDCRIT